MGWTYRLPSMFAASYLITLRQAAASPETPIILYSSDSRKEVNAIAEKFRYLKWCIRQDLTASKDLSAILETYDVRSKITEDEVGFILWITAKPTKLSDFFNLNPDLALEVAAQCQ